MLYWERNVHSVFTSYVFCTGLGLGNAVAPNPPPPAGTLMSFKSRTFRAESFKSHTFFG